MGTLGQNVAFSACISDGIDIFTFGLVIDKDAQLGIFAL